MLSNNINWRPYQIECKKAIKENFQQNIKQQLIVQATGTGKRLQSVDLIQHFKNKTLFLCHREELIQQAYEEIQQYYPMDIGIIKSPRFELGHKVTVASVQTLYNRLDKIPRDEFELIIVDECFPAGTLVDGKPIETYKSGDVVSSFDHLTGKIEQSKILRVIKHPFPDVMYDFGHFQCTGSQPIFIVGIGYCLAKEIYYAYLCYKVMHYGYPAKSLSHLYKLWNSFCSKNLQKYLFNKMRKSKKNTIETTTLNALFKLWKGIFMGGMEKFGQEKSSIHSFSKKRFWLLLRKMQKGVFQQDIFSNNEFYKPEICFKKNEREESNDESGNQGKNGKIYAGKNISVPGRKSKTNKTTGYYFGYDANIIHGISHTHWRASIIRKKRTELLQGGFGLFRNKTCNRNRWKNSPLEALEILRQEKDGSFTITGLDCDKIYKRRSKFQYTGSNPYYYVYNLEVEGNNNYFAERILVHNCHHYVSRTYLETYRHFTPRLTTIWTATPQRLDGLSLSNIAEKIVFQYKIENGIDDGYLCPLIAYQINTPVNISSVKRTAGDFNQKELSVKVDTELRNTLIMSKYKQYANNCQSIAYCVDIDHAYHLRDVFRNNGISCETVVSDTKRCPNRTEIVREFSKGNIQVLTNVNILTEGFDYADIGCILMCRPTQSETLYIQSIGRGTRLKSEIFKQIYGRDNCIVLDFVDNSGKHSLVNSYELEKNKPIEERKFLPPEMKEKLLAEREKRERMMKTKIAQDRKINLLKLPELTPWNSAKMTDPATEKQLNWIKTIGLYEEGVEYTKWQASELISSQLAKTFQIHFLATQGYDVSGKVTLGQYQKVKEQYDRKNKYRIEPKPPINLSL